MSRYHYSILIVFIKYITYVTVWEKDLYKLSIYDSHAHANMLEIFEKLKKAWKAREEFLNNICIFVLEIINHSYTDTYIKKNLSNT